VELLSLAHERGCEAQLAAVLAEGLQAGRLPDLQVLRALFAPDPTHMPTVHVKLAPLSAYEVLVGAEMGAAA
jgi:hypothetical protein